MTNEIRKDYIQDKYVIIAPRREARPHDVAITNASVAQAHTVTCRLCPDHIDHEQSLFEVKHKGFWNIKVVPNKFPAVSLDNAKSYGVQEVVVETREHGIPLEEFSVMDISELLHVYQERTKIVTKIPKIEYILIFKNAGGAAGASLGHAHSQIFATQFLPPHLFDKSQKTRSYKLETGHCVYCEVLEREIKSPRFVYEDEYVVAFTPYASMHNYEIWILPRRHLDNITLLNDSECLSWAKILKRILQKIVALNLPYNYYFHQVVHDEDQHVYMKITPRGSIWAGVEIGSGLVINPITPEDAAEYYRKN